VETRILNQAVKRNSDRFPDDFMFQLTEEEYINLRSQSVISNYGGRRYLPYVFTEQGVAMLSSVLTSDIAIKTNIIIMRAFVLIRRLGMTTIDSKRKINSIERKYDHQFKIVFDAIRQLLLPPPEKKKKIKMGFSKPERNKE